MPNLINYKDTSDGSTRSGQLEPAGSTSEPDSFEASLQLGDIGASGILQSASSGSGSTSDEPPPAKRIRPAPTPVVTVPPQPASIKVSGVQIIMTMDAIASDPALLASARANLPLLPWRFVDRPTPTTAGTGLPMPTTVEGRLPSKNSKATNGKHRSARRRKAASSPRVPAKSSAPGTSALPTVVVAPTFVDGGLPVDNDGAPPAKRQMLDPTPMVPAIPDSAPTNFSEAEVAVRMIAIASDPKSLPEARILFPTLPWSVFPTPESRTSGDPTNPISTAPAPILLIPAARLLPTSQGSSLAPVGQMATPTVMPFQDPMSRGVLTSGLPSIGGSLSTTQITQGSLLAVDPMTIPITLGTQGSSTLPQLAASQGSHTLQTGQARQGPSSLQMAPAQQDPSPSQRTPLLAVLGQPAGRARTTTHALSASIDWNRIFTSDLAYSRGSLDRSAEETGGGIS